MRAIYYEYNQNLLINSLHSLIYQDKIISVLIKKERKYQMKIFSLFAYLFI
jgi:hypothetical protein